MQHAYIRLNLYQLRSHYILLQVTGTIYHAGSEFIIKHAHQHSGIHHL